MSAKLQSILALKPKVEFVDVAIPGVDEPVRVRALVAGDLLKMRAALHSVPKEEQDGQAAIQSVFLTAVNEDGSRLFESAEQVAGLPVDVFTALSKAAGEVLGTVPTSDEAAKNSQASQS